MASQTRSTVTNTSNPEMRPKRNIIIEFKVGKVGKVSRIQKSTGKDKNRLKNQYRAEEKYDFVKEIE